MGDAESGSCLSAVLSQNKSTTRIHVSTNPVAWDFTLSMEAQQGFQSFPKVTLLVRVSTKI